MAYNTGARDPLFDSEMQATLQKRGRELIGLALVLLSGLVAVMLATYSVDDPNWMISTDAPVQNWTGRFGASIAAYLVFFLGVAAWAFVPLLVVWGVRMMFHLGDERAARLIFAPIFVFLLAAPYAATLVPDAAWIAAQDAGLGGKWGDVVLGVLLTALPFETSFALKAVSLALGAGCVFLGAFVLGFTGKDIGRGLRMALYALVLGYNGFLQFVGRSVSRARMPAKTAKVAAEPEMAAAPDAPPVQKPALSAVPPAPKGAAPAAAPSAPVEEPPQPRGGGLISLIRRASQSDPMPEPELVESYPPDHGDEMPGGERIKAKIADAIRARSGVAPEPAPDVEDYADRPLTKGRGRRPQPLLLDVTRRPGPLRSEPPLTGDAGPAPDPLMPASEIPPAPEMPSASDMYEPYDAEMPSEPEMDEAYDAMTPDAPAQAAPAARPIIRDASGYAPVDHDPMGIVHDPDDMDDDDSGDDEAPLPLSEPRPQMSARIAQPEPKKVVQHTQRKAPAPSRRASAEAQPGLAFEDSHGEFDLPPLGLLTSPEVIERHHLSDEALEENARMLESVLDDYGVKGEIVSVRPGPVVTMYELEPAPGLKASRVIGLADDIARSMSALSARIATVPGRSVIGIELPNENREKVVLREILSTRDFGDSSMPLPLALGKDIGGDPIVANLAKMPHLLIAGTTGSGKSVAINTMILSLLYKLTPDECRLIMIDPKMLELSVYDGIPHLLSPVVTDPKKAVVALKWVVGEMEERYRKMSKMGVRNIQGYNGRVEDALSKGEMFSRTVQTGFDDDTGEPVFETEEFAPERLPYIVVIVDEMADLMMVAGKEIEACIQRLAQMARASGIHLIMATQRPSVDVITGTIKANFPTRISFQVTSKIDSRTILGEMGAEQLLGMGDMLYMAGGARITRCHGPFVSDEEVEEVVSHLKTFGPPTYVGGVVEGPDEDAESNIDAVLGLGGNTDGEDALYDQAVAIVIKDRKCSTSYIQRKLAIGYNKAARLVEQMEDQGVVSSANHVGKREILVPEQG
ncbi:DNA translocase FtsK [Chachezhania antarctica]|uniref:DNA translocase FtsK n=1 Tax=Chachezhania antarctica TaxID=2340860 RepID=UPI000EB3FBD4|nr:DNA translocase FtsK [Chachezhania antarctica]